LAEVAVCSETVHTKLVQVLGDGTTDEEVHAPSRELLPAAVGASELSRSMPVHPAAAAIIDNTTTRVRFFIVYFCPETGTCETRADFAGS
jgi:hypothetical protein